MQCQQNWSFHVAIMRLSAWEAKSLKRLKWDYKAQMGKVQLEINNQKTHSVMNKGKDARITFIFDYVPKEEIEKLSANK